MSTSESLKAILARSAGEERFRSDKRQFAGMLFALAICVTFQPLAGVSTAIGPNGTTANSGMPLAGLIAGCIVIFVGTISMLCGYLGAIHDYGNKYFTGFVLGAIQLTWMPFLTDLTNVGMKASSGSGFIPPEYNPTEGDVKFVGAMGMIGILTYASAFVGSMAFMAFALFAYEVGKPTDRTSSYFASRITFYGCGLLLAGFAQLLLGSYVIAKFGNGPLLPAIGVAMFIVHWPELNIFVGLVQMLVAVYALLRRFGIMNRGKDDNTLQYASFFMWFCVLSMQILTQVGYAPGGTLAPAAPTIACLSLGISIMTAYLDYKMRNTSEELPDNYYGESDMVKSDVVGQEMPLVEADAEMGGADQDYDHGDDSAIKQADSSEVQA